MSPATVEKRRAVLINVAYIALVLGAFYLFIKAPGGDANAFSEKAKKRDLLLVPGDGFGCPGYFRICYCVSYDMIKRSLPVFRALLRD